MSFPTSAQPQCRAGPNWCTWGKSACSSQSKAQTHINIMSLQIWYMVTLSVTLCSQVYGWCRGGFEGSTFSSGNHEHFQWGQSWLQTSQWVKAKSLQTRRCSLAPPQYLSSLFRYEQSLEVWMDCWLFTESHWWPVRSLNRSWLWNTDSLLVLSCHSSSSWKFGMRRDGDEEL